MEPLGHYETSRDVPEGQVSIAAFLLLESAAPVIGHHAVDQLASHVGNVEALVPEGERQSPEKPKCEHNGSCVAVSMRSSQVMAQDQCEPMAGEGGACSGGIAGGGQVVV